MARGRKTGGRQKGGPEMIVGSFRGVADIGMHWSRRARLRLTPSGLLRTRLSKLPLRLLLIMSYLGTDLGFVR
jgi:hypothetical protein